MHYTNKIIWITGASSGIGEALAYAFAPGGNTLILSSRRVSELERVAEKCKSMGSSCLVIPIDLADVTSIENSANQVLNQFGYVDILVNNGGISQRSLAVETPVDIDRKVMEIDYFSGVILTKKILPSMLARKSGHIVVISSITGLFGFKLRSAYAAAKHAIVGFYESVWVENNDLGIDVTVVCPGRVHTNISLHAITKDGKEHGVMDHGQDGGISSEKCADEIISAMRRKKVIAYIGRKELIMIYLKRYIPSLFYKLVKRVEPT